jgi:hypothetical protein
MKIYEMYENPKGVDISDCNYHFAQPTSDPENRCQSICRTVLKSGLAKS